MIKRLLKPLLIIFFLSLSLTVSKAEDEFEKRYKEAKRQLQLILEQNEENNRKGLSHLNHYIFSDDPAVYEYLILKSSDPTRIEILEAFYGKIEEANNALALFASTSKTPIYIYITGIFAQKISEQIMDLGSIDLLDSDSKNSENTIKELSSLLQNEFNGTEEQQTESFKKLVGRLHSEMCRELSDKKYGACYTSSVEIVGTESMKVYHYLDWKFTATPIQYSCFTGDKDLEFTAQRLIDIASGGYKCGVDLAGECSQSAEHTKLNEDTKTVREEKMGGDIENIAKIIDGDRSAHIRFIDKTGILSQRIKDKEQELLEERLVLLQKESGINLQVVFCELEYTLPCPSIGGFADGVWEKSEAINKSVEKSVLILAPYYINKVESAFKIFSNYALVEEYTYAAVRISDSGFSEGEKNGIREAFYRKKEEGSTEGDFKKRIAEVYKAIPKPYTLYSYSLDNQGDIRKAVLYNGSMTGKGAFYELVFLMQNHKDKNDATWYTAFNPENNPILEKYIKEFSEKYVINTAYRLYGGIKYYGLPEDKGNGIFPESPPKYIFRHGYIVDAAEAIENALVFQTVALSFSGLGPLATFTNGLLISKYVYEGRFTEAGTETALIGLDAFLTGGLAKNIVRAGIVITGIPQKTIQKFLNYTNKFSKNANADDAVEVIDVALTASLNKLDNPSQAVFFGDLIANEGLLDRVVKNPALVEAWQVLKSRPLLRKDLDFLAKISKCLTNKGLTKVGIDKNVLGQIVDNLANDFAQAGKKIEGVDNSLADKLEKEIFDNLDAFGDFVQQNPNLQLTNFDKGIISKLTGEKFAGRKGANWILKDMTQDASTFNGKVTIEFSVKKSGGEQGFIDVYLPDKKKYIEYKAGPYSIDKSHILEEFIKRDLHIVSNLSELEWRISEFTLTKEQLIKWLKEDDDCRTALNKVKDKSIENQQKFQKWFNLDNPKESIPDSNIDYFVNQHFNTIFK